MDLFVLRVRGKGSGGREKRSSIDSSAEQSPADSEVESDVDGVNPSSDRPAPKRRASSKQLTEQRFVFEVDDGAKMAEVFTSRLEDAKARDKIRKAQKKVQADLEMDLESVISSVQDICFTDGACKLKFGL